MAQEDDKNPDQSMEEILQSIKRIIADEDDDESADGEAAAAEEDVLELTEMVGDTSSKDNDGFAAALPAAQDDAAPASDSLDELMASFDAPAAAAAPEPELPAAASDHASFEDTAESLISEKVAKATATKLHSLMQEEPASARRPLSPSMPLRSGATVEDLVVEALRPMLKEWLDANLEGMVERLVEKEVKRLSSNR